MQPLLNALPSIPMSIIAHFFFKLWHTVKCSDSKAAKGLPNFSSLSNPMIKDALSNSSQGTSPTKYLKRSSVMVTFSPS